MKSTINQVEGIMSDLPKQDLNRLRNAIHNEVGVTKQEIRDMVEEAVKHLVDKQVKQLLPDKVSMDKMVDDAVRDRTLVWRNSEQEFNDSIELLVAKILAKKIRVSVETRS